MYEPNNPKHQRKLVDIVNKAKDISQFNYWNRAAEELNKEFNEELNHEAWRSRYRYLKEEYKVKKTNIVRSYQHNHNKEERLLSYLRQERTIEFLCKMLDMQEIELLGYIQKLQMQGHDIINTGDTFELCKKLLPTDSKYRLYEGELKEHKICVISDTHLCNKKQQITLLNEVYDECQRRGITTVLHCGDITDGMSKRPEHIYELFVYGADDQAQYVIDNYPKRDGITTYFITGNHDGWNYAKSGVDIGKAIAQQREDMIYLGNQKATVMINNCRIDLFHPMDGSCFDDKTEIMTKNGWKLFKDINTSDLIATMTKDNNIFEWQEPKEITNQYYDGDMYFIKSKTVDMAVTPNHGLWIKRYEKGLDRVKQYIMPQKSHNLLNTDWQRMDAHDVFDNFYRQKWQMTRVCNGWIGTNKEYIDVPYIEPKNKGMIGRMTHIGKVPFNLFAELVAWYVTEGHADNKSVCICQSKRVNPKEHKRITDLIEKMGLKYCVTGRDEKDITISSKELSEFLKQECGHLSRHKYLPEYIKNAKKDILKTVLFTMIDGDGWYIKNGGFGYKSISKRLRDDFQEIAIKLGYAVTEKNDSVTISNIQCQPTINKQAKVENYKGNIYCVNVDNGLILVRRNGKAIWSHNSYAKSYSGQKTIENMRGGDKPNAMFVGHHHKMVYFVDRNVHYCEVPCLCEATKFIEGKRLENTIGAMFPTINIDDKGNIITFNPETMIFYRTLENDYEIPQNKVYKKVTEI